jgi:hypothetical protein
VSDDLSATERRRSERLALALPLKIQGATAQGQAFVRQLVTSNVSSDGVLLAVAGDPQQKTYPDPGRCRCGLLDARNLSALNTEVTLANILSGEIAQARAVRLIRSLDGKLAGLGLQMLAPTETFWGLSFQLHRVTARLMEIDQGIQKQPEDMDLRILRAFRAAVAHLGDVASVVQRWHSLKAQGRNPYSVLDALDCARVANAVYVLGEITTDVDASELSTSSEEFVSLVSASTRLHDRITRGGSGGPRPNQGKLAPPAFSRGPRIPGAALSDR